MTGNPNSDLWRVAGIRARQGPVWNFSVAAGTAVWIPDSDDDGLDWLDWLLGLTAPPEGTVHWQGRDWQAYSPDAAGAARGTIGCVLTTGGALANLDMDENVWLPARIHRRPDAAAEIETWARRFRCWPLPARRPAVVRERERQRLLWTRAFAGRPLALVLERPLRNMPEEDRRLFLAAVADVRAAGCAVVWLEETLAEDVRAALAPLTVITPEPA